MSKNIDKWDISIIIPVYNVEDYISDCIQSVMNQERKVIKNIECIIVDDRGNDNSMDIVKDLLDAYKGPIEFKIIRHGKNRGLSAARNTGIRHARGKYLFFIDSDDFISNNCLDNLYSAALTYPKAELIIGSVSFLYEDGSLKHHIHEKTVRANKNYCDKIKKIRKIYFKLPVSAWNKLIKKDWLEENQLFFKEGILYEDSHWLLRCYFFITSYAIVLDIPATYYYRQRANSITSNLENRKQRRSEYNSVFLDAVSEAPFWDNNFTKKIVEYLFELNVSGQQSLFKSTINRLLSFPQAKSSHKLVFSYLKLNRPWIRMKIALDLCNIIK